MKTAVVLFNLGGPDSLPAVRPFLFNLFSDRAIINLPQPFRYGLATLISSRREKKAQGIYQKMGGKSPILEQTQSQAAALEKMLRAKGEEARVFPCMRYWHPRAAEVVTQVKQYGPDGIVLLPLYPQYSTSTTASSFAEWHREAKKAGLASPTRAVCCYPDEPDFIASHVARIREVWPAAGGTMRLLFSAHGLPEKTIRAGDPYQWQVEKTVSEIIVALQTPGMDYAICYQSRVGPLKWIGPSLEEELQRAARDGVGVMVIPVSFVSEHSETLVELDIDYRERATELGIETYIRVPALGCQANYITSLAALASAAPARACSSQGERSCPPSFRGCGCANTPSASRQTAV